MDALWTKILEQAPQVGVLCFLVVTFLKHIDKRDSDHLAERQAMRESIDNNSMVVAKNTESISLLIQTINKR